MINKHKKFLTAAVFCAIASTGFVLTASAEETMTHDLDEVVVEADKDALPGSYVKTKGSIGILNPHYSSGNEYRHHLLSQRSDDSPMQVHLHYDPRTNGCKQ